MRQWADSRAPHIRLIDIVPCRPWPVAGAGDYPLMQEFKICSYEHNWTHLSVLKFSIVRVKCTVRWRRVGLWFKVVLVTKNPNPAQYEEPRVRPPQPLGARLAVCPRRLHPLPQLLRGLQLPQHQQLPHLLHEEQGHQRIQQQPHVRLIVLMK